MSIISDEHRKAFLDNGWFIEWEDEKQILLSHPMAPRWNGSGAAYCIAKIPGRSLWIKIKEFLRDLIND